MKVLAKIEQEIDVDVTIEDVIEEINETPMPLRWNHFASVLNKIDLSPEGLDDRQRLIVEEWLQKKLNVIKLPEGGNAESKDHFAQSQMEYHGTTK